MSNQIKNFECGHQIPADFNQERIELVGRVTDPAKIDTKSYESETTELYPGLEFYYYYEEKTYQFINMGEPPKARLQNLCQSCLLNTLKTEEPHYGDGVYFTQHSQLFDSETHQEVLLSHGIPYRPYRATYICMDASVFRKIYKTGGVLRSSKHTVEQINDTKMVSVDNGVLYPLCLGW